jgi:hypothetical protein
MAGLADVLYLAALPRVTGDRQKAAPQHSQTWETGMGVRRAKAALSSG